MANYPNPLNPTTTISYRISGTGSSLLILYNSIGEHVRTLVNEAVPPGEYRVEWDGKDDSGKKVVSGVYFYRLESSGQSKTRKMILLR